MFVTPAYAQAAGGGAGAGLLAQLPLLIAIFAIFYFLLIRPQQKKLKEHQAMIEALRRGDQVITQGGVVGKVTKVREDGGARGRRHPRESGDLIEQRDPGSSPG